MTTNVVLCSRCRTQVSHQHLYFTDSGDLTPSATQALCDAHKFMDRWENSPYSNQNGAYGCYNCGHHTISITVDYDFQTQGAGWQDSNSLGLTVFLDRDMSEAEHYDCSFELEVERSDLMPDIRFYISHRAVHNGPFREMLEYPNASHDRDTIANSETLDTLLETIRFTRSRAYCEACEIEHAADVF